MYSLLGFLARIMLLISMREESVSEGDKAFNKYLNEGMSESTCLSVYF